MSDKLLWGVPSFWIERFPLYYGRHLGLFEERGIALAIRYYWGGPELARAVGSGEALIGEMGMPPFLKAYSQGLPARVIASSTVQQLDHYIVGSPDIDDLTDLKGKRVGILSFGSCDEYFLRQMLTASGIDPDSDVEIVPLGDAYGDIGCFSSGKIDAGFLVEPFVALAESEGVVKMLATVKDYFPSYQWGIIFAHEKLLQNNLDIVQRAMSAYRESCQAIQNDTEQAAVYGAQVFQMKKEIFRRALRRGLDSWELEGRIDIEGMKNCIQIHAQTGIDPEGLLRQL
jgi:NitT/TauT family transport system substrate-binding protein